MTITLYLRTLNKIELQSSVIATQVLTLLLLCFTECTSVMSGLCKRRDTRRKIAPATRSRNMLQEQSSLVCTNEKYVVQQNFCFRVFASLVAQHIFRWYTRGSFAPGACCGSVLQEQAPSCVPALIPLNIVCTPAFVSVSGLVQCNLDYFVRLL